MLLNMFNDKQKEILEKIGYKIDTQKDYNDDEIIDIDEAVQDYLMVYGFDKGDIINNTGLLCESIIDIFSEL